MTCRAGSLQANGLPKGYDAEKYLFTAVMDENESWNLDKNMQKYCTASKCAGISKGNESYAIMLVRMVLSDRYRITQAKFQYQGVKIMCDVSELYPLQQSLVIGSYVKMLVRRVLSDRYR